MKFIYDVLIKYKIPHLITWIIISFILTFMNYDPEVSLFPQFISVLVGSGLAFPACRYAALKLVPRYLYRRKIGKFSGAILLLALINSIFTYLIVLFLYHLNTGLPMFRSFSIVVTLSFSILLFNLMIISISCIAKIISDRFFMEQQLLEIEKEKISTELNFLRSQVNPHFLFNVMNTIYFQIDKTNTNARASIEKLSEMLRYQLYECTSDKIDIVKEVEYIRNYVSMQTLRMEKGTDIKLLIDDNLSGFFIAPLLLLPLIENSFKHISNFKESDQNQIQISVKKQEMNVLLIEAVNTYDPFIVQKHLLQTGGLGLQNLKRRLELLYPGKHELQINKEADTFKTVLKLQYHD